MIKKACINQIKLQPKNLMNNASILASGFDIVTDQNLHTC